MCVSATSCARSPTTSRRRCELRQVRSPGDVARRSPPPAGHTRPETRPRQHPVGFRPARRAPPLRTRFVLANRSTRAPPARPRMSTHVHAAIEGSGQRPKGERLVRRETGVRPLDPHDRPLCRRWLLGQQMESDVRVDNVDRSTDPMAPAEYSTPVWEFDHARSGRPPGHLQGPTSRTACRPHHSHRLHWAGHGRRSTSGGMRRYGPPNPDLSVGPD